MLVPINSVTTAFLALGWVLASSMAIQMLAIAVRACVQWIWRRNVPRGVGLAVSLAAFAVVVTWASVVGYRAVRVDWREVAIIFSPLVVAPLVAFIGFRTWAPNATG